MTENSFNDEVKKPWKRQFSPRVSYVKKDKTQAPSGPGKQKRDGWKEWSSVGKGVKGERSGKGKKMEITPLQKKTMEPAASAKGQEEEGGGGGWLIGDV